MKEFIETLKSMKMTAILILLEVPANLASGSVQTFTVVFVASLALIACFFETRKGTVEKELLISLLKEHGLNIEKTSLIVKYHKFQQMMEGLAFQDGNELKEIWQQSIPKNEAKLLYSWGEIFEEDYKRFYESDRT